MKRMAALIIIVLIVVPRLFGQNDIKITTENEATIKTYLDSSLVDPIEGIYKTVSGTFYRIAVKKYNDRYLAIILDAEDKKRWKVGMVKAYLEKSSLENLFSIRWIRDKSSKETIGRLENETVLKIPLPSGPYGSADETLFLKIYPSNKGETNESNSNKRNSKISVTGSGFLLTTNGLIATNAHVVNGAKKIEVKILNEFGSTTYDAKLMLIDTKNDVAIVDVDDASFKELDSLPYGILEKADIGEKSFTIGYPLNDVMGTNYKVTDGIISAKSGIADDVRYYQISIPLQPGNSGGPLFNSEGNIIGITSAKLNSKAVGVPIENVNYAIKATYLLSLMNMIPNIKIPTLTNQLATKELKEQVKILKNYVCLIQVTD